MTARILVIDDEDMFREDLAVLLQRRGFQCQAAPDGAAGLERAAAWQPDVVLCDIRMPGRSGIDILDDLRAACPQAGLIMISAHGTIRDAVEAFRKGAVDYIFKPPVFEEILTKVQRYVDHRALLREVTQLRRRLDLQDQRPALIGESPPMRELRALIERAAGVKSCVLLMGESGVGKEVVARGLHDRSPWRDQPFVAINCAALPEALLESELFGHRRGAFSGATQDQQGLFELAQGGTIFLDEISETSPQVQAKLLRVVHEKEVMPLGGAEVIPLDLRIVASTNRDLEALIAEGRFRSDLYYRLKVVPIRVPPLRERVGDIPLLVDHFLERLNASMKRKLLGVDRQALQILSAYPWPGNVRELQNVLERSMLMCAGDYIGIQDLPADIAGEQTSPQQAGSLRAALRAYEREYIKAVLDDAGGDLKEVARRLGINLVTVYRKLASLGLK